MILRKLELKFNSTIDINDEEFGAATLTIPYIKENVSLAAVKTFINFLGNDYMPWSQENVSFLDFTKATLITIETTAPTITEEIINVPE